MRGRATCIVWKRKFALFLRMFAFYFFRYHSGRPFGHSDCNRPRHPELDGVLGGSTEAAWGGDLAPSSSWPTDQDDALGARSSTILGRVPWRLGDWWRLAEREHSRGAGLGSGWAAGGAGLASWGVGTDLGRLEPAAELDRFDRKCRIAWDDFCAAVKHSTNPSTAGPNRPVGETGESRKGILSASFISVALEHH